MLHKEEVSTVCAAAARPPTTRLFEVWIVMRYVRCDHRHPLPRENGHTHHPLVDLRERMELPSGTLDILHRVRTVRAQDGWGADCAA